MSIGTEGMMMTEDALKPCAHCGDKHPYIAKARGDSRWFTVVCYGCQASSGPRFPESEAVAAWNRRADTP